MNFINVAVVFRLLTYVILGVAFVYLFRSWLKAVKLALSLPGPKSLPIIGNVSRIIDYVKSPECYEKYDPIFRLWLGVVPLFVIVDPKYVEKILGNKIHSDKSFVYSWLESFAGRGLVTSSGFEWRRHRKLIQPCFQNKILESFLNAFSRSAAQLTENLPTNRIINITPHINECIFHIIHQVVFGLTVEEIAECRRNHPFKKDSSSMFMKRLMRPWLLVGFIYNLSKQATYETEQKSELQNYVKIFLDKKLQTRSNKTITRKEEFKCFLDMFLDISEENPDFTLDDVLNETSTFILAGQESVASATAFTLHCLAKHVNVQEKARNELKNIFGDDDRQPTYQDVSRMVYLEQCIKETLRMFPSAPVIARKVSSDVKMGEYDIPEGSNVVMVPMLTHRLNYIFENPEKFDPDRFTSENVKKIPPFAYIPFSAGLRNCIGYKFAMLEMKVAVSTILRKYRLEVHPESKLDLSYKIILRAKGGIWMKFST